MVIQVFDALFEDVARHGALGHVPLHEQADSAFPDAVAGDLVAGVVEDVVADGSVGDAGRVSGGEGVVEVVYYVGGLLVAEYAAAAVYAEGGGEGEEWGGGEEGEEEGGMHFVRFEFVGVELWGGG